MKFLQNIVLPILLLVYYKKIIAQGRQPVVTNDGIGSINIDIHSNENNNQKSFIRRVLQHKPYYYWLNNNNEKESLETTEDGEYPVLSCPIGTYRTFADTYNRKPGGLRLDGCLDCPKGRYGDGTKANLHTSLCSGVCPRGRYRDVTRGTSINDCFLCPEGTFGDREGLTTKRCSGYCTDYNTSSKKYYSNIPEVTSRAKCEICPPGYIGWQCKSNLRTPAIIAHEKNRSN